MILETVALSVITLLLFLLMLTQKHQLRYHWVKGHAENPKNNRCDELAVAEWKKIRAKGSPWKGDP